MVKKVERFFRGESLYGRLRGIGRFAGRFGRRFYLNEDRLKKDFNSISNFPGMKNRSVGSHMMNDYSSRSHTMLTVHITSEQQAENSVFISKQGKINFVDLAGSEQTKKTNSEGKTLEEANNINKSNFIVYSRILHEYLIN